MSQIKTILILGVVLLATWLLVLSQQDDSPPAVTAANEQQAEITFMDILNTEDLRAGVLQAVRDNDDVALQNWQDKAVEVGLAAELPDEDMVFLAGKRGRDFLVFRAKRTLFYEQFEHYYLTLKDIGPLKKAYPEAQSLFAEADQLVMERDIAIDNIARELAGSDGDYRAYVAAARKQWQEKTSSLDSSSKN